MAYDHVIDGAQLDADITRVADAIRAKGGTGAKLTWPQGFVDAVTAMQAGGGTGSFEKIEILEWTPATNTKEYRLPRSGLKYCIIADKSVNGRPNRTAVSLMVTNAEFFAGYKPIVELATGFQGGLETTANYYGVLSSSEIVAAANNFVAGRTYDVILVY